MRLLSYFHSSAPALLGLAALAGLASGLGSAALIAFINAALGTDTPSRMGMTWDFAALCLIVFLARSVLLRGQSLASSWNPGSWFRFILLSPGLAGSMTGGLYRSGGNRGTWGFPAVISTYRHYSSGLICVMLGNRLKS